MIRIKSERLEVEIGEPGQAYRGSRFDWTGFITQVKLDGRHTFCSAEALKPGEGTGGMGLCNEFGIFTPIGYDDAKVGEQFPKLGVGLLTREDGKPYSFSRPYPIKPFSMKVHSDANSVTFVVEPIDCRGYAARLTKVLRVEQNRLSVEYRLANVGSRPLVTREYCHNFISLDGHPVGPEYRLRLCAAPAFRKVPEVIQQEGAILRWRQTPAAAFHAPVDPWAPEGPGWWEMVHEPTGVGLRETDDFHWASLAVWGTDRLLSPEAFIQIDVAPGKEQVWRREYTFFANGQSGL